MLSSHAYYAFDVNQLLLILLDTMTAKHGIIPTERETEREESWKMVWTNRERALGGGKKEGIKTAVDDIEEAEISN